MWTEWKALLTSHKAVPQSTEADGQITVWFTDGERYETALWRGAVPHGVIDHGYTQDQNDADLAEHDALVSAGKINQATRAKTDYGIPLVSPSPRTGRELIMTSHNFCDPTTWYTTSERLSDQVLTSSDGGTTYPLGYIAIDLTHGKHWDEDAICLDVDHGYAMVVTSDSAAQTERDPFASSGGDYVVDYLAGTLTFAASQGSKVVRASFSRMVDSIFSIIPDPGYRIDVERAKALFSEDAIINDTIDFEIWVYNPADFPNKVRIKRTSYKRMRNYADEAEDPSPHLPAIGGAARGTQSSIHSMSFRYGTIRPMESAYGVELRVRLRNHVPFGGECAMATFYCTVEAQ